MGMNLQSRTAGAKDLRVPLYLFQASAALQVTPVLSHGLNVHNWLEHAEESPEAHHFV